MTDEKAAFAMMAGERVAEDLERAMRDGYWKPHHVRALQPIIAEINADADATKVVEKEFNDSDAAFTEIAQAFATFIRHRQYMPAEFAERINDLLSDWVKLTGWTAVVEDVE